jgi:hypothetical protein
MAQAAEHEAQIIVTAGRGNFDDKKLYPTGTRKENAEQ